jgi:hypothetical protein
MKWNCRELKEIAVRGVLIFLDLLAEKPYDTSYTKFPMIKQSEIWKFVKKMTAEGERSKHVEDDRDLPML